jgi:hypothetical protein
MVKNLQVSVIPGRTVLDHSQAFSYIFAVRLPYWPVAAGTGGQLWPAQYGIRSSTVDPLG